MVIFYRQQQGSGISKGGDGIRVLLFVNSRPPQRRNRAEKSNPINYLMKKNEEGDSGEPCLPQAGIKLSFIHCLHCRITGNTGRTESTWHYVLIVELSGFFFDKLKGRRNTHNKKKYPINIIANLNLSASIQLPTILFISSGELPSPALAIIASLIGYT